MPSSGLSETNLRPVTYQRLTANGVSANSAVVTVPANCFIDLILYQETAGNTVTGGLKFGSTLAGTDVVASQTCTGGSTGHVPDSALSTKVFTTPQTIYAGAVSSWNGAKVNLTFIIGVLS